MTGRNVCHYIASHFVVRIVSPLYTIASPRPIMPSRRIAFVLASLFFGPSAIGQSFTGFNPEQQVITTSTASAQSVHAVDLDGDGDADVLSASSNDDTIAWYENLTVNLSGPASPGSFGAQQVITASAVNAMCVYAADLDGDGDMDVLSASSGDAKVAWYENLTVNLSGPASPGSFGGQQVITTSADGARSVHAVDLDGDGDMDVLSASDNDDKIAWYENLTVNLSGPASSGSFGGQQVGARAAMRARMAPTPSAACACSRAPAAASNSQ